MCVEASSEHFCAENQRVCEEGDSTGSFARTAPRGIKQPLRALKAAKATDVKSISLTAEVPVRLSDRKLLERVMKLSLEDCSRLAAAARLADAKDFCSAVAEPGSSKDTTTLDLRSNSPRNSKSVGTVSQQKRPLESKQRKDAEPENVSLSSLTDPGKKSAGGVGATHTVGASEISNHSRLRSSLDDMHEADSHHTPRSQEAGALQRTASIACSGSYNACDGEGESGASVERISTAETRAGVEGTLDNGEQPLREECVEVQKSTDLASTKRKPETAGKGVKRPRSVKEEAKEADDAPTFRIRATVNCEDAFQLESVFLEASLQKGKRKVSEGDLSEDNEESLSRACSAAPAQDDAADEDAPAFRRPAKKKPRTRPGRKGPGAPGSRRSSRVAALESQAECAEADDDYLPPGDAPEAAPTAAGKRLRTARTRFTSIPKPCIASSAATATPTLPDISLRSSRSRWSSSVGSVGSPLGSSSGSRRLRSQPLDISCLVPDAYAVEQPAAKRSKHTLLQAGLAALQEEQEQLASAGALYLMRSTITGTQKPVRAWRCLPEDGVGELDLRLKETRERQSTDTSLLDEPPLQLTAHLESLAQGLGASRLAKAVRAAAKEQVGVAGLASDSRLLQHCRSFMPSPLQTACSRWEERLSAPCPGAVGEATTCIDARRARALQQVWDDLLARTTLEATVVESFQNWLLPASGDEGR